MGGARVLGGDGCKGLRRNKMREGKGRLQSQRGKGGARVRGRLMGRIEIHGPTHLHDSS
jgi:hypothetical protein